MKSYEMKIALFTGGGDPHYAIGLVSGLAKKNIQIDFLGNPMMKLPASLKRENVKFLGVYVYAGKNASKARKVRKLLITYCKLILYAIKSDASVFHILWPYKLELFERIVLFSLFSVLGKRLVFTAHNVNARRRDIDDNFFNQIALRIHYRLSDAIIVHTKKMKNQMIEEFGVKGEKIFVVPYGINNIVPVTDIGKENARAKLYIDSKEKVLLFFGNIAPYKGLHRLLKAFAQVLDVFEDIRLVIAGRIAKQGGEYWELIESLIRKLEISDYLAKHIEFISDDDIEFYFKAADVLILPYEHIYQSGILFLSYRFGLPVIVTDVGSLKDNVLPGRTGFVCKTKNPYELASKIVKYFHSDLYINLPRTRESIKVWAFKRYSWDKIAPMTIKVYGKG